MINQIPILNLKFVPQNKIPSLQQNTAAYSSDTFIKSNQHLSFGSYFDYVKVTRKYFRGQKPDVNTLEALKCEGVNTVINLTENVSDNLMRKMKALGIKHYNIHLEEDINPTADQIKDFIEILKKPDTCAYVHCREGRNRTGIMTAIYDVLVNERKFENAYKDMLENGYDFKNHPNLGKCLESVCTDKAFLKSMGSKKEAEDPDTVKAIAQRLISNPIYIQKNGKY